MSLSFAWIEVSANSYQNQCSGSWSECKCCCCCKLDKNSLNQIYLLHEKFTRQKVSYLTSIHFSSIYLLSLFTVRFFLLYFVCLVNVTKYVFVVVSFSAVAIQKNCQLEFSEIISSIFFLTEVKVVEKKRNNRIVCIGRFWWRLLITSSVFFLSKHQKVAFYNRVIKPVS